jgi:hypothetical protein
MEIRVACLSAWHVVALQIDHTATHENQREKRGMLRSLRLAPRGRPKQKSVTPVVGGWVKVRKRTRVRFFFSIFFYRVFELPSSRNAQKRDKKKLEKKSVLDFWSNFL